MYRVRKILDIDEVHKSGLTGKGIGVAVLDTGIILHQDLKKNICSFVDFVNNKTELYDDNGHGSHVSGIIAGNGVKSGGKYRGAAPDSKIIMLKCLDKNGTGRLSNAEKAFDYIINNREKYNIRIINVSVGSKINSKDRESEKLIADVEELWKMGFIVVAAAGNNGPEKGSITAPGSAKSIITVGANDDFSHKDGNKKSYSGRGPTDICIVKPEIVCPGTGIVSCNNKNGYSTKSGTSMAVPVVSGIIALLLEKNPFLCNKEVKKILHETAINIGLPKNQQGWGLINAKKIIDYNCTF